MKHTDNYTLLCDFYELTMGNGYFQTGLDKRVCYFDVFFRQTGLNHSRHTNLHPIPTSSEARPSADLPHPYPPALRRSPPEGRRKRNIPGP